MTTNSKWSAYSAIDQFAYIYLNSSSSDCFDTKTNRSERMRSHAMSTTDMKAAEAAAVIAAAAVLRVRNSQGCRMQKKN